MEFRRSRKVDAGVIEWVEIVVVYEFIMIGYEFRINTNVRREASRY